MKIDFLEPKAKDFKGDMSKKWHIYYRVFNPMTGQTETVRDFSGLYVIKEPKRRYEVALEKCVAIYERLKAGWRSFYSIHIENMLSYFPEQKIHKSFLSSNSVEAIASEYLISKKIIDSMRQEFTSKSRGFVAWLKSKQLGDTQITLM